MFGGITVGGVLQILYHQQKVQNTHQRARQITESEEQCQRSQLFNLELC